MLAYIRKLFSEDYSRLLNELVKSLPFSIDSEAELWGPVVEYRNGTIGGANRLKKVSALIHSTPQKPSRWLLLSQTNELHNGCEWTSRPVVQELSEAEALEWLERQRLSVPAILPMQARTQLHA